MSYSSGFLLSINIYPWQIEFPRIFLKEASSSFFCYTFIYSIIFGIALHHFHILTGPRVGRH